MKINWKLRLKNKAVLTAIVLQIINIVYMILSAAGIVPTLDESLVTSLAEGVIGVLVLLGVVTDPTTEGLSDSELAMSYNEPNNN